MKRKLLSIVLALCLTLTLTLLPTMSVAAGSYADTNGHWAESSIERWSAYGIIQGSNGQFDPNGQLTCAQLATIIAKLLKLPAAKDAGFTDNTADAWYYDAINRCAAAGILNGNGDGTVTPEAPISRERAIVMLGRALGIEPIREPDLTKYTDAAKVAPYAQGMVAAMIEAGIVGGVTADELAPQDNINRASTVTILDRAISTYADEAGATVKADGKGIVLVVAENVKITNAPEGSKIVVADGATGLSVNGKSVSDDQTYIVPKTEPAKPSSSSSGGHSHSHSYVYTDNGDGTHTGRCYANDSTLAPEAHTIVDGKCKVCGAEQTDADVASVKKSNGTYAYYTTLAEAINAAADGDTVTLVKAAEEDITVSGGKAITIDLNGMKLTNKSGDTIVVEFGTTLTVTGSGTVDNVTHGKAAIYNNGTVILNGGSYTRSAEASTSIENANGNSYYNILNHGTMTIEKNVSVTSSGHFSSLIANGYYNFSDTNPRSGYVSGTNQKAPSLTINGGTFSGGINTIKNDDNATLTVNNGSFSNMTQAAIQNNHVATINGGTFDANANHAIENRHFDGGHNTGSVTVTNGVFTGGLYNTAGAAWNIIGGTFSSDPTDYVAAGYAAKELEGNKYQVVALFAGGTGTAEDPFLIATSEQFKAIDQLNGAPYCFKQTADIAVAAGDEVTKFAGVYDGGNQKLSSARTSGNFAFLFNVGGLSGHATFENINVEMGELATSLLSCADWGTSYGADFKDLTFTSTSELTRANSSNFGFVVSNAIYTKNGTAATYNFENIKVNVNLQNTGTCTGVLIGSGPCFNVNTTMNFINCTNNGTITGTNSVGFLYGNSAYIESLDEFGTIKVTECNCTTNAVIKSTKDSADVAFAPGASKSPKATALNNSYQQAGKYIIGNCLNGKAISVAQNAKADKFSIAIDDASGYTYKLALNVAATYRTLDGEAWNGDDVAKIPNNWDEAWNVSNGLKYLITPSKDASITETLNSFHAYDKRTAMKKGIETDVLTYNEDGYAIVVQDGTNCVVFNTTEDTYIDSSVSILVYAYSGNTLVGTKAIK